MLHAIGFYFVALLLLFFAYRTVTSANPIHSSLYLALTMILLAGVYFTLGAPFIAGVQLIVYAGAVMVLFVMVLMLFDLEAELKAFSKGLVSGLLKVTSAGMLAGLVLGAVDTSLHLIQKADGATELKAADTKALATLLFTKYLFAFEVLGVLLLVVAIGVVAISKIKGGTHARH